MKIYLSLIALFFSITSLFSQCPEDIFINNQAGVDSFALDYPNCSVVEGITITGNDITNLSGLSQIVEITGSFVLTNTNIQNFEGLNNLINISGSFYVGNNDNLLNFQGFDTILSINSLEILNNDILEDFEGSTTLQSIGLFSLESNPSIIDFNGLQNVTTITTFDIRNLTSLQSFNGLQNLLTIENTFRILNNPALIDLTQLEQLVNITNWLWVLNCDSLINLDGLENITNLDNSFRIIGNENLTSISGLSNLDSSFDFGIRILDNPNLPNCNIISVCENIGNADLAYFEIENNATGCNNINEVTISCEIAIPCPTETITFSTQAEIDSFGINFPDCVDITIPIIISGADITDLSGLSQIESTSSSILINDNPQLITIETLDGISLVGANASVFITNNASLTTLTALTQVGNLVGEINITSNPLLTDLSPLSGISNTSGLYIVDNASLTSLNGLQLDSAGYLGVIENTSLLSLEGLATIAGSMLSLEIISNPLITNLNGLEGITNLTDYGLVIDSNENLSSLEGLENIDTSNNIFISFNPLLENLEPLDIFGNVTSLGISFNNLINDISALEEISLNNADLVFIRENPNLLVCGIAPICDFLQTGAEAIIENNATGCNTVLEVAESCNLKVSEIALKENIILFPNPISNTLNISVSENINYIQTGVITISGKRLFQTTETKIDVSSLSAGIYFAEISTKEGVITKKIIKE